MSSHIFLHFSDIHFGQERGGSVITHKDVRERLVDDIKPALEGQRATGIIVTGDIAYSGKKKEYEDAGEWLDRIAEQAGCESTDVYVVPGNHDIDLNDVTEGVRDMLGKVASDGEKKLDKYLEAIEDRELLYKRFVNYRDFAAGYGCRLNEEGGNAGEKDSLELAPGRKLAFLGLNSALICGGKDEQGKLLLGERQRTIPLTPGLERVVLLHHPLHWMQDHRDALNFVKNRARVLLTGHEHMPSVSIENINDDQQFMQIQAGATTPPRADRGFTYTYNILGFGWIESKDALEVLFNPRIWSDVRKQFVADENQTNGNALRRYELGCPQFRQAPRPIRPITAVPAPAADAAATAPTADTVGEAKEAAVETNDPFPALRLQFFRKLNRVQRLRVLIDLDGLPETDVYPTMGIELYALDRIRQRQRLDELRAAIERLEAPPEHGKEVNR